MPEPTDNLPSAVPDQRGPKVARPRTNVRRFNVRRILSLATGSLEARGASLSSLVLVAVVGVLGYLQFLPNGPLVLLLFGVVLYEFERRLDQGLPLMQVAALLGVLQWTVGPVLAYGTTLVFDRYEMYVGEAEYFGFALPGTAAYAFGLLGVGSSVRQRALMQFERRDHFLTIGLALNAVALGARFAAPMVPGGLAFAVHLLSQLGYVGVIYFLYSGSGYRWPLIGLALLPLVRSSGQSAMFHDLILWMGLLFCYWFALRKHTVEAKAGLLVVVGLILFTIQAVKQEYRAKVWYGQEASLLEQMAQFWNSGEAITSDVVLGNVIARLNQGWIVSAVLHHVPDGEPYAVGETLKDAVVAALVPRILMEDKVKAGGHVNFRRFTGLDLADDTSMGVSPLGEAYLNFGRDGGILLMLGFGAGFAGLYALCLRWAVTHATFIFWIPLIFYQAIKAETEFSTVLNQLSKGGLVAFTLHWMIIKWWLPNLQVVSTRVPVRRRTVR